MSRDRHNPGLALLLVGVGALSVAVGADRVRIRIDASSTYQKVSGWEVVVPSAEQVPGLESYREELIERAVDEIGINRVRIDVSASCERGVVPDVDGDDRWTGDSRQADPAGPENDDDDADHIEWTAFHFDELDFVVRNLVLPLQSRVASAGERLFVYLHYSPPDTGLPAAHGDPAEYAEFVLATYIHLQREHGLVPDAWEIGSSSGPDRPASAGSGERVGRTILAAANKLQAHGFSPGFIAPSADRMDHALRSFNGMMRVQGALQYVSELGYSRYGGVSAGNQQRIANLARTHGIRTSMLEWRDRGNDHHTLHQDLKIVGVSAWQQGPLVARADGDRTALFFAERDGSGIVRLRVNPRTRFFRQYFRFVRGGAIRIAAWSEDMDFDPLAFVNVDGGHALVVKANRAGLFVVQGLPPGPYAIKYTTPGEYDVDGSEAHVEEGRPLLAGIPSAGVVTVFARSPGQSLVSPR